LLQYNKNSIVNGKNNWWGTINKSDINRYIYDENDDNSDRGILEYEPYENSEIAGAGVI
jgi:hypothetical protein